jgi:hypothetical protein
MVSNTWPLCWCVRGLRKAFRRRADVPTDFLMCQTTIHAPRMFKVDALRFDAEQPDVSQRVMPCNCTFCVTTGAIRALVAGLSFH